MQWRVGGVAEHATLDGNSGPIRLKFARRCRSAGVMLLIQLRYFHEVSRLGSIRKASESLNVAPSSISRQIAVLERQFGTTLLERSARGVRLSHAGTFVADFARATLLGYDTLRADLDDLRGIRKAVVRLAAIDSVIAWPVLAAVQSFRSAFPDVRFRLLSLTASEVVQSVKAGTSDLGLSIDLAPDPDLQILSETEAPLVVVVAPTHPLAGSRGIALSDLRAHDLAVHEAEHGIRRMLDQAAHAHGFNLEPVLSSSSLHALREFARRGLGAAVLTRGGVSDDVAKGALCVIPIRDAVLNSGRLKLIARADRRFSRVLRSFCDALTTTITAASEVDHGTAFRI